ncbi:putative MFS family arabinose efflux permease [Aquitalea magnusonii]|uniref:Putative MFS family arabinose efflux permease n=2 Tax=Chromobacteriaceae TaxID=1499392 RepID=A0A318JNQ7_9NEIS|nr:putative MFS family arabinose efflux permease [Aquitalea magnusonii]
MRMDGLTVVERSWRSMLRAVASLLLAYALLVVGNALGSTETSLSLLANGVPVAVAGMVQSAYYAGFFMGGFFCSGMIRQYGHHRAFAALTAIICVLTLCQALFTTPWLWLLARLGNGLAMVGIYMVVESWLNGCVSNSQRGQLFSLYLIISYLGASAGQWLLKLPFSQAGWPFIIVAMLFALAIIPVTLTQQRPQVLAAQPPGNVLARAMRTLRLLGRRAPLSLAGALLAGCFNSAFYTMLPAMLSQSGRTPADIASFMGLALLAAPLLQWPMGKWADSSDRATLLARCALVVAVLSLILTQLLNTGWMLPLVMVYVSVAFTFYGTLSGIANDAMPARHRVEVSASLLMVYALGGTLGPLLCSAVMAAIGPAGYFVVSLGLSATLGGYAWWTVKRWPLPSLLPPR